MDKRVLIVDDMKENIDILMHTLKGQYAVMAARSGEAAVALMEKKPPDLVLMDVTMPGMGGFDVLAYMSRNKALSHIPLIFITAEYDAGLEEKGLGMGAVDYICKPFNTAVVSAKVRNYLEHKKLSDSLEDLARARARQIASSREAIVMGLSLLSESRDRVTGLHINRMKEYARVLTDTLMKRDPSLLDPKRAALIVLYSPLHDMGKAGIPGHVLNSPHAFTDADREIMQSHTLNGADILRRTDLFLPEDAEDSGLDIAVEIVESHHEKYDGTGYPAGKNGEEIPLSARIIALPDVYDALRSPRPYKPSRSHEEAALAVTEGDGRTRPAHFDPMLLDIFKDIHPQFDRIYNQATMI